MLYIFNVRMNLPGIINYFTAPSISPTSQGCPRLGHFRCLYWRQVIQLPQDKVRLSNSNIYCNRTNRTTYFMMQNILLISSTYKIIAKYYKYVILFGHASSQRVKFSKTQLFFSFDTGCKTPVFHLLKTTACALQLLSLSQKAIDSWPSNATDFMLQKADFYEVPKAACMFTCIFHFLHHHQIKKHQLLNI